MNDLELVDDLYLAAEAALPAVLDLSAGLADVVSRAGDAPSGDDPDPPTATASRENELTRLAREAAEGNRTALEALIAQIHAPVLRYCRARLGTSGVADPDDVTTEVLVAVCAALPQYSPEVSVMAFVYGIARRKVLDAARASRPADHPRLEFLDVLASESSDVSEVRRLLDQLPEQQRGVLVLRVSMGFTAAEAARMVGTTPGAVRVTQHRALSRIRKLIGEQPPSSANG